MSKLYQSPLRVYLCLLCLALWGAVSGLHLPVSLFPNSSKPKISVSVSFGGLTPDEFIRSYGKQFENRLKGAAFDDHEVEKVTASYEKTSVYYTVEYKWGTPPESALREVQTVANSYGARFPTEIRDNMWVWGRSENSGFLAVTFYSSTRSLDDLYSYLEPILTPRLANITDATEVEIWNPNKKAVSIELNPEKMAHLGITPLDVSRSVEPSLSSYSGGSVSVGLSNLAISMKRPANSIDDLDQIPIVTRSGRAVHLSDIATIDLAVPMDRARVVKTSGAASLILFAEPKPGGNIKKMAEDIMAIVKEVAPTLEPDVQYKVLVDPSEFIRSAVNNVLHEVFLAAFLAVIVLFIFIGNIRNVITAAIEIPMSIVLAFIMMKWFGINLNLISLGGLALSAGMNVDASVVVMENIFRRFEEHKGPVGRIDRLRLVVDAVNEVRFPIMASTIASLVVFLPLALTSGLTNAILGDLALAVVFSHGFSAFVALILVPTVRLQMMSLPGNTANSHSPIESQLKRAESFYAKCLGQFMRSPRIKYATYAGLVASLVLLITFVLPNLPREIVGTPDTDWVYFGVNTEGNTMVKQMEEQASEVEAQLLKKFSGRIQYTFTQINEKNSAHIMARLTDKSEMLKIWKEIEAAFPNTPLLRFSVGPWNPSELPIPDPPALTLVVRGTEHKNRIALAKEVNDLLDQKKIYSGVWTEPGIQYTESVILKPQPEQWAYLSAQGSSLSPYHLADMARVATEGREIGNMAIAGKTVDINLLYPKNRVRSTEDLSALPIGVNGKIISLGALAHVSIERSEPSFYREDGKDLVRINASLPKDEKFKTDESKLKAEQAVKEFMAKDGKNKGATVVFEDASKELNEALKQLGYAVALSILLIFLTMVFQFGDVVNALLVLVAIPLGFIGVLISLFVFKSTSTLR